MSVQVMRSVAGAALVVFMLHGTDARADVEACASAAENAERAIKAERLRSAREPLAACLAAECPAVLRESCGQMLAAVEANTPSIVVSVRGKDDVDVVSATLRIDDVEMPSMGGVIEIDPGKHVLEARDGDRSVRLEIVARSGEKQRTVKLVLEPRRAAPLAPLPPPAPIEQRPRRPGWLAPSLLGLGGLGVASFTFFGLRARSDVAALERDCKPYCSDDRISHGRTQALVADVSLGVAVVALAAGAYFLFVAR